MSEHQVSVGDMKRNPGEHSPAEMVSELMGLVVAVGLMLGAIVGVMYTMIGSGTGLDGGSGVIVAALVGAAIGAAVAFIGIRVAEGIAGKSS